MTDLTRLSASELAGKLAARDVSAEEVTRAHLTRIEAVDAQINAFVHVNEHALDTAKSIDEQRSNGDDLAPLAGVPVALKDLIVSTDMPTTAGSRILANYRSPFDATVVERLRAAGLVMLGSTNTDEFGMGSSTETSVYGPSRNPWDTERVPGGSSGGAAAALAAFTTPLSLGTDTGGSIRQPASLTGVVGVKQTYGAVSRYGAISLASSLDQIGSLARTVLDAALMQDVIIGGDVRDSNSLPHNWSSMADAAREGSTGSVLKGLRVGVITQLSAGMQAGVATEFARSIDLLTSHGAEVVEIDLPELEYAVAAYYLIQPAEASSNLAKFDSVRFGLRAEPQTGAATSESVTSATRGQGFGAEVKRRIILGTHVLSAGHYDTLFRNALKARTLVIQAFAREFERVDVMLTPTSPVTAGLLGASASDPMLQYLADATTIPASLAGLPSMSVPVGIDSATGMPVGAQVIAPAYGDDLMFRVAAALEQGVSDRDGRAFWQSIPSLEERANA